MTEPSTSDLRALVDDAAKIFEMLSRRINLPPNELRAILNWSAGYDRMRDNVVVPHETQEDP